MILLSRRVHRVEECCPQGDGTASAARPQHHTAAFFREQRAAGGVIGPEGYGWPRLRRVGKQGVGLVYLRDGIAKHFAEGAQYTPDGLMWPEPIPMLVEDERLFSAPPPSRRRRICPR